MKKKRKKLKEIPKKVTMKGRMKSWRRVVDEERNQIKFLGKDFHKFPFLFMVYFLLNRTRA